MQVSNNSNNYLKTNNNELNFSNFERFNRVLSFLELPFFFDNNSNKFYRFEGSIYNFNYEITYRNFSVDVNLGLKVKTKLLMSLFMQLPQTTHNIKSTFSSKTSFLLKNGFFSTNLLPNNLNYKVNDYFVTSKDEAKYKNLFKISMELSDISLNVRALRNKFNRAVELNMFDVDTFISTINANWVNINNLDTTFNKNSIRSITVVNDSLRTFSFLVSSLDSFKILHTQFFTKYLYFKKAQTFLRTTRISSLFYLVKNKSYYLFFYTNLLKITDNFLIKNLNYLYIYNYVVKLLLFFTLNYKLFNISNIFILKYLKYISMFICSSFFLNSFSFKNLDTRSSLALKQITLKILSQFMLLFKNSKEFGLSQSYSDTLNFFSSKRKNKLKRMVNVSSLLPLNYSKIASLRFKKCRHVHSLHRQPSELFSAVSRLGYTATSILHTTTFNNLRTYHYAEKSITNYYGFLKFFSDFILSFFKRNFVNSVLVNNYYNPKYLLFRYFSTVKLFFPLLFKRWVFNNLAVNLNDLSLILNYLNYSLLVKKISTFKYKKKEKYKKISLKNKFNNLSKVLSLKNLGIYKIRSRSYSTLVLDNKFRDILGFFSEYSFKNMNYCDYTIFLLKLNKILSFNDINQSFYFIYLLFCLSLNSKFIYKFYFFNSSFFIIDCKLLVFFELLRYKISSLIFTKDMSFFLLRYTDFNIKVDFYTFIILNRFVEYFRCFKYNEYLSYNNVNNEDIYIHFSKSTEEFYFLPFFFEFKRSLFFNKYLIFKFYNKTSLNNKLIDIDSYLNYSFFKLFFIMLSVKKIFNIFLKYFYMFIISYVYYFGYKSLFLSARTLQLINIISLDKLTLNWKKKSVFFEMISFISRKHLQQSFLNNYSLLNSAVVNSFNNIKICSSIFIDTLNFLLVDYIDNVILSRLLELQSYTVLNFLEFVRLAISRSFFIFMNLKYVKKSSFLNILFLKTKLDFLLWSVYNSVFILNYHSPYFNNLNIFINKLTVDSYIRKDFFNFSKFVLVFEKSWNITNFFLMYIAIRDYILKLTFHLFIFYYFYNLYFIYMFLNFFKFIQFLKIKLIFKRLNYYKVFNAFFNPKFNYLA